MSKLVSQQRKMGKYTLLRELGRGGMGVVYLAEDEQLRRLIALKVLSPAMATDDGFQERFRNEARLVSSLMHPNIVYVNSLDRIDESLLIDMEYVDGRSVAELQQDSVISVSWALEMTRQILEGLAACHALGVVHRDLKPANVMVAADGRTKIADFGIATALATATNRDISRRSTTGALFGTPQYVAPEAWDGAEATQKWDLYAVGVMLHELLSGGSLIATMSPLQIARDLALGIQPLDSKAIDGISPELSELLHQLTAIDPAERPDDALEVQRRLVEVPEFVDVKGGEASTIQISVKPNSPFRSSLKRPAIWRTISFVSAVALFVVAAGWAIWFQASRNSEPVPETKGQAARPVLLQEQLTGLPDAATIANSWRVSSAVIEGIYTLRSMNSAEEETITLLLERKSDGTHFIVSSEYAVWSGTITPGSDGQFSLSGEWGGYGNPYGTSIRYGTVRGSGAWMDGKEGLVLNTTLQNLRDNSERSTSYAGGLADSTYSDTRFYLNLEAEQGVQTLLVNDLVPRGLNWARSLLGELPAISSQKLVVPFLKDGDGLKIDGLLAEAHWSQKYYNDSGRIGAVVGRSDLRPGMLYGRYSREGMILGLQAEVPPDAEIELETILVSDLVSPLSELTSYRLSVRPGAVLDASQKNGEQLMEWLPEVEFAATLDDDVWTAELRLPWRALGRTSAPSGPLRMDIALLQREERGTSRTLHEWGHPTLEAVEHGVWVGFDEP